MITKETMTQYEAVRQSGVTNMFDYYMVMRVARRTKLIALSSLTRDEYVNLLQNFSTLMKEHKVNQEPLPQAEAIREEWSG